MKFEPAGDGEVLENTVLDQLREGIAMEMYNSDESIRDFARACLNHCLELGQLVFFLYKHMILKQYDGWFYDIFQEFFNAEFKGGFKAKGIIYQDHLINDMVASSLKWNGEFVWACKNYDGDVQSDIITQGFGSLGMIISFLMAPAGKTVEAEAAHGTVTHHYR